MDLLFWPSLFFLALIAFWQPARRGAGRQSLKRAQTGLQDSPAYCISGKEQPYGGAGGSGEILAQHICHGLLRQPTVPALHRCAHEKSGCAPLNARSAEAEIMVRMRSVAF